MSTSSQHGGYREGNPTYRLDETERWIVAALGHMQLWSKTAVGQAFGVTRKTVDKCMAKYPAW